MENGKKHENGHSFENGNSETLATCKLWSPSKRSSMDTFRDLINSKFQLNLKNYHDLYQWSIEKPSLFWEEFWVYAAIIHSEPPEQIVDETKKIDEMPEWFKGAKLNFTENLLERKDENKVALYVASEKSPEIEKVTFGELKKSVAVLASGLRKLGIEKGDRIVGYLPNGRLAVEAMLASASFGAIWSSTSPEFGVAGVLERFQQIQPKVIFSVSTVFYNGKSFDHLVKLKDVVTALGSLKMVVIETSEDANISEIPKSLSLTQFCELESQPSSLEYSQLPFNHPLFILYSSGTTGPPKCMVHSAGGTLIQHMKEHMLHANVGKDDIMLYYTTTGWMMWNWLVSVLATGSSAVLYDGSPFRPPTILWDLVDKIGITVLGISAKWMAVVEDHGLKPAESHSLKSLNAILSTGSPLKPQSFDFVYKHVKKDVLLGSITGGSDIISCFALSNPALPVYRGEIQGPGLGMSIACWNEGGSAVLGEKGELVCTKPFPSMPTNFWNDNDMKKYRAAYFTRFPNIWHHGDYCTVNPETGGIVMLGRSDGTLNPSGVRFGSAEIYNVVESFKEIQDSLCVSRFFGGEEQVILFLKLCPEHNFNAGLVKQIQNSIRVELSPRHIPSLILPIKDIPYTISGKKVEVAVKKIISGEKVTSRGFLSNPESLDLYTNIEELSTK